MTGRLVDPSSPVNWSHPLNRGLVGWWAGLPNSGWAGGKTLPDLTRGGRSPNDGTLTNGPGWAAGVGGFRAVAGDGSDDLISVPHAASLEPTTGDFTIEFYARVRAGSGYAGLWTKGTGQPQFCLSGTSVQYVFVSNNVAFVSGNWGVVNLGQWDHLVWTQIAGVYRAYQNGVQQTTGSYASFSSSGSAVYLLADTNSGGRSLAGDLGHAAFFGRGLAAVEVAARCDQARRGHPDTLNWVRPWSFGVEASSPPPPPASAFIPAFAPGF